VFYGALAFAVALTARAKGPDLSLDSVVIFSSIIMAQSINNSGSWFGGLMLAIIICGVIGAINGLLTVFLKIPAIIVTIVISAITSYIGYVLTEGRPILVAFPWFGETTIGALIVLAVTFFIAFLLNKMTKIGVPMKSRSRKVEFSYMLAYVASAVIAAIASFYMLSRMRSVQPTTGSRNEIFILFVFACVFSSRTLDNAILSIIYAAAPTLAWGILSNVLIILDCNTFIIGIITGVITLAFLIIAYISCYSGASALLQRETNLPTIY